MAEIFLFTFHGGVSKANIHQSEKFLLFFLVGEQEVPFYQMTREGLATRVEVGKEEFATDYAVCKLFVSRQGFGIPKQYHSFYLRLDPNAEILEIKPFSGEETGFYFRGKSKMMERKEVLEVLPEKAESRMFFSKQEVLPLDLKNRMVHVDRSEIRVGVRHIRVGKHNDKS